MRVNRLNFTGGTGSRSSPLATNGDDRSSIHYLLVQILYRPRHSERPYDTFLKVVLRYIQNHGKCLIPMGVINMGRSPLPEWTEAKPFTPFTVTMSSGRFVQVNGPEMIILGKRWDTLAFEDEEGYDRTVIIRHSHITSIDAYDPVQMRTPED